MVKGLMNLSAEFDATTGLTCQCGVYKLYLSLTQK